LGDKENEESIGPLEKRRASRSAFSFLKPGAAGDGVD